jgi:hypothetical protein
MQGAKADAPAQSKDQLLLYMSCMQLLTRSLSSFWQLSPILNRVGHARRQWNTFRQIAIACAPAITATARNKEGFKHALNHWMRAQLDGLS